MEMKSPKLLLVLILVPMYLGGTITLNNKFYMTDVWIDDVQMKSSEYSYNAFFSGEIIRDTIIWNDYEEEYQREFVYIGDSLRIYMSSYDVRRLYTKYIEVWSSVYKTRLKDTEFRVGMSIAELGLLQPEIEERYNLYIKRNENNFYREAYFGIPLLVEISIENNDIFYPCQGLKFQIKEGVVISILIDFRTDGDF